MSDINSSLPIRSEADVDQRVQVKIVDYTTPSQGAAVDASGRVSTKIDNLVSEPVFTEAKLQDGAGNAITSQVNGSQRALDVGINVAGVQVDPRQIRALTATDVVTANIKDATGTAFSNSNPLPVTVSLDATGTETHNYLQSAAVAAAASANHTLTVASGTTFFLTDVYGSASGKMKIEIQIGDGAVSEAFATKFVQFNSTAETNTHIDIQKTALKVVGTVNGTTIKVIRTNLDKTAQDLYTTIVGSLV